MRKYYTVTYNNKQYEAIIETYDQRFIIKLGGHDEKCIFVTIYRKVPVNVKQKAQMEGLSYKVNCNLTNDIVKGQGTIELVHATIAFIKKKFPFVTHFIYSDASTIQCSNKIQVPLPYVHMAKHGLTWYQDKFDAVCLNENYNKKIKHANKEIDSALFLIGSWQTFWKAYIEPHEGAIKHLNIQKFKEYFEMLWSESETLRAVFKDLAQKDCKVFQVWLEYFFFERYDITIHNPKWQISFDHFAVEPVRIQSMQKQKELIGRGGGVRSLQAEISEKFKKQSPMVFPSDAML
jgi:hypothetical protein